MLNEDSDSLKCDLAETYRIFDMFSLPLRTIAVFSYGLGDDSRIRKRLSGTHYSMETLLLAHLVDSVNLLLWAQSKPGTDKPESLTEKMLPSEVITEPEENVFESPEEFEARRRELLKGGE